MGSRCCVSVPPDSGYRAFAAALGPWQAQLTSGLDRSVHQDAHVFVSRVSPDARLTHPLPSDRGAYLYVIGGALEVNGEAMPQGSAAQITDEPEVTITATTETELILVDVRLHD